MYTQYLKLLVCAQVLFGRICTKSQWSLREGKVGGSRHKSWLSTRLGWGGGKFSLYAFLSLLNFVSYVSIPGFKKMTDS